MLKFLKNYKNSVAIYKKACYNRIHIIRLDRGAELMSILLCEVREGCSRKKGNPPKRQESQNLFLGRCRRCTVLSLFVESYRQVLKIRGSGHDMLRHIRGFLLFPPKPDYLVKKYRRSDSAEERGKE